MEGEAGEFFVGVAIILVCPFIGPGRQLRHAEKFATGTGRRRMQNGASDRRIGTARRLGGQSAEIVRRSNAGNAPTPAMHYPVAVFPHYRGFSDVRAGCEPPLILPGDVRVSLSLHRSL